MLYGAGYPCTILSPPKPTRLLNKRGPALRQKQTGLWAECWPQRRPTHLHMVNPSTGNLWSFMLGRFQRPWHNFRCCSVSAFHVAQNAQNIKHITIYKPNQVHFFIIFGEICICLIASPHTPLLHSVSLLKVEGGCTSSPYGHTMGWWMEICSPFGWRLEEAV